MLLRLEALLMLAKTDQLLHLGCLVTVVVKTSKFDEKDIYVQDGREGCNAKIDIISFFVKLTEQLCERVEECKKAIWEIERTVQSFSNGSQIYTPQDVARIIQEQNMAFMTLVRRVAVLHEETQMRLANFEQFKRMYI